MSSRGALALVALCLACRGQPQRAAIHTTVSTPSRVDPTACAALPLTSLRNGEVVMRSDQLGYVPGEDVDVVIVGDTPGAPTLRLCDLATGHYLAVDPPVQRMDTRSLADGRMMAHRFDLGRALHAGTYQVETNGAALGMVRVDPDVDAQVIPGVVAFLRSQRCGPTTVAVSGHGPCHLHASVADADQGTTSGDGVSVPDGFRGVVRTDSGPSVDVEGGWHDAGDYVKFVGTTAFVVAVDLAALRDHPNALGPAGDALREELRWGVTWLAKMLGGPVRFHQVSGEFDHDAPARTPESDTATPLRDDDDNVYVQRPAFRFDVAHGRGGNLLGRGAAAFALAAQVLAHGDAERAHWLAVARDCETVGRTLPHPQEPDPPDFYPEESVFDDLALGAAEIARATQDPTAAAMALRDLRRVMNPDAAHAPEPMIYWGDVTALALEETWQVFPAGSPERAELAADLHTLESPIEATAEHPTGPAAVYGYALPELTNGSEAQSLGAAAGCLALRRVEPTNGCVDVARRQLHWLFGENPFGMSFMVGVGDRWPQHVHHALSEATGREVLGAIVGGPVSVREFRHMDPDVHVPALEGGALARYATREVFYEDVRGDFVTNEPAIDFTAALVWVLAELSETGSRRGS